MKIAVIFGTRPEIIKLSPVIRELKNRKIDFFIIHTNQHFSYLMDKVFLDELKLPAPKYNLKLSRIKNHGEMVGKMLIKIEKILINEKPDLVIVQGDTNTTLAGGLASSKLKIKLAHVEAGLRSYDRSMPEEINRIIVDHLSDLLFCPTQYQKKILLKEGINKKRIFVVGNTIVDAVFQNLKIAEDNKKIVDKYKNENYFLLTLHRPSNVDDKKILLDIIKALEKAAEIFNTRIVFPIHPRTKDNLKKFGININSDKIKIIKPLGYLEMLIAEKYAKLILTDSGGIQEEACVLKVPCITLRYNTERPETIKVGANILVGNKEEKIINGIKKMFYLEKVWRNPFGTLVSKKIINSLIDYTS